MNVTNVLCVLRPTNKNVAIIQSYKGNLPSYRLIPLVDP